MLARRFFLAKMSDKFCVSKIWIYEPGKYFFLVVDLGSSINSQVIHRGISYLLGGFAEHIFWS